MSILVENTEVKNSENYSIYVSNHGTYKYRRVNAQAGNNTVTLSTGGGNTTTFELNPNVYNFGRSHLKYVKTIVAVGGEDPEHRSNVLFANGVPEMQRIRLYNSAMIEIARIDSVHKYLDTVLRPETKITELITKDRAVAATDVDNTTGSWGGLQITNGVGVNFLNGSVNRGNTRYNASAMTNPLEAIYAITSDPEGDLALQVDLQLSAFLHTALGMDRNVYLGSETLYLEITWNSRDKCGFICGANGDAGMDTDPAELNQNIILSNMGLWMAQEDDPMKITQTKNYFLQGGRVMIPYVYTQSQSFNAAGSQYVTVKYGRGNGARLKKIYFTAYAAETLNTYYDHSNMNAVNVNDFYVEVNGQRTTPNVMLCGEGDDWLVLRDKLKGSCILSSNDFYYNWFHMVDFTDRNSPLDGDSMPYENLVDGRALASEVKLDIYANAGEALNYYVFAITCKELMLNEIGTLAQPV